MLWGSQTAPCSENRAVRMRTKYSLKKKLALLLIVAVAAATVEIGPARVLAPAQAVMDFDGDQLPDHAELTSNGSYKNIHLTLSSPWVANLHFSTETSQSGSIHAEDIDYDGDNDL